MAPTFGTSGLRGLVTELSDKVVQEYTRAFLATCSHGGQVFVGYDLRPSSPEIAASVIAAASTAGLTVVDCGAIPTPALAQVSMAAGTAAIMVTGSHIPADRNGLKFYVPTGEISKNDEARINAAYAAPTAPPENTPGAIRAGVNVASAYTNRLVHVFGHDALEGLRIGIYRHSSVARDIMENALTALGAKTVPLASSDTFIPVDTEAVDPDTRALLASWCVENNLDAVVSTDGDGDRPMVSDALGQVVPGDVLGILTAVRLGARIVVTPVSTNDMVHRMGFDAVHLTRIGSPFVVATMEKILSSDSIAQVVGFEANGGFLLGFTALGSLAPLMTRDSLLPIVATLAASRSRGVSIAQLVGELPPWFTAADRVQEIDQEKGVSFLSQLDTDANSRTTFFAETGAIADICRTDGLRLSFEHGDVVHLRPSGNAPEFRIYAQASRPETAKALVELYLDLVAKRVQ